MQIARMIFVGSVAALAALTAPALANNTAKTTDPSTSSPCKAYQQAPDGTWWQFYTIVLGNPGRSCHVRNSAPAINRSTSPRREARIRRRADA